MHAIKFGEGRRYRLYGNDYIMLLSRSLTDRIESEHVRVKKGRKTPRHAHDDLEQVYFILKGKALLEVGKNKKILRRRTMAYIPRNAEHKITALSNLEYVYISCWFKKVPAARTAEELKIYEKKLMNEDRNGKQKL